jgi:hypothetical protein
MSDKLTEMTVTEECIELIRRAGEPLPAWRRPAFYERVSELLRSEEVLVPARVQAACQRVQGEFLNASATTAAEPQSPASPRSDLARPGPDVK